MTVLSGALNTTGWRCRKDEKIEKVTDSQDDDFVDSEEKHPEQFAQIGSRKAYRNG
jgi:hypothetical protein